MNTQLVKPIEGQHQYVVGVDFGHGESSAAICPIEWEKSAGQRESKEEDIDMDIAARKKVIPSAICRMPDGTMFIGDEVFEHLTDNNGIRLAFKQKPVSLDGEKESLMMDYMKAIYARIRESRQELTDDNHIVYIARPSGWKDKQSKKMYCQMALSVGIPLAGLTSESRAAIFYARNKETFTNDISRGGLVFDLGSSTLDFTYLSEDNEAKDHGYNHGASMIDEVILNNMILIEEDVAEFINRYPEYRDALKFKARKFKEEVYSRNATSPTNSGFPLCNIIPEEEPSYDIYQNKYVKLKVKNLEELNAMIDEKIQYMKLISDDMQDFKTNHIPGKTVNGVFLTGGASRMNFIRSIVEKVFSLPIEKVKLDNDNPSLTISRGIALLGTADAVVQVLEEKLKKELQNFINIETIFDTLVDRIASCITDSTWLTVEGTCNRWVTDGETSDSEELVEWLKKDVVKFKNNRVPALVNDIIQGFVNDGSEDIRNKMNEIIRIYAPDREIKLTGSVQIDNIESINETLGDLPDAIVKLCAEISYVVSSMLIVAIGTWLWGPWAALWLLARVIIDLFRTKEEKRRVRADKLLENKDKICLDVRTKIHNRLKDDSVFKVTLTKTFGEYFTRQLETNLKQVRIPIE